ncbi:MAG: hypothetical protein ACLR23_08330, partial [Clostridia bacterium]
MWPPQGVDHLVNRRFRLHLRALFCLTALALGILTVPRWMEDSHCRIQVLFGFYRVSLLTLAIRN